MAEGRLCFRQLASVLLTSTLLSATLARAQTAGNVTTRPAGNVENVSQRPDVQAFEAAKLGQPRGSTSVPTTSPAAAFNAPAPAHSIGFDLGRMAVALSIVLAMILGARWLFTHFFAGARAPATSRAVKVLSRTSLAPRQQILLLQIGRRVVVVGESNGQLSTLSQVEDPDEVASLVGQLQEEQIQRAASFGGLFGRAQRKMEAEDEHSAPIDTPEPDAPSDASNDHADPNDARSELSSLLEKVRSIRNGLSR